MIDDDDDADDGSQEAAGVVRLATWGAVAPAALVALFLVGTENDQAWRPVASQVLGAYSALLVVLVAGARFGLAISGRGNARRDAVMSTVAIFIALAVLMVPAPDSFMILVTAFAALGAWDAFGVQPGAVPRWYGQLRTRTTFVLVAAMFLAFVATA